MCSHCHLLDITRISISPKSPPGDPYSLPCRLIAHTWLPLFCILQCHMQEELWFSDPKLFTAWCIRKANRNPCMFCWWRGAKSTREHSVRKPGQGKAVTGRPCGLVRVPRRDHCTWNSFVYSRISRFFGHSANKKIPFKYSVMYSSLHFFFPLSTACGAKSRVGFQLQNIVLLFSKTTSSSLSL